MFVNLHSFQLGNY